MSQGKCSENLQQAGQGAGGGWGCRGSRHIKQSTVAAKTATVHAGHLPSRASNPAAALQGGNWESYATSLSLRFTRSPRKRWHGIRECNGLQSTHYRCLEKKLESEWEKSRVGPGEQGAGGQGWAEGDPLPPHLCGAPAHPLPHLPHKVLTSYLTCISETCEYIKETLQVLTFPSGILLTSFNSLIVPVKCFTIYKMSDFLIFVVTQLGCHRTKYWKSSTEI